MREHRAMNNKSLAISMVRFSFTGAFAVGALICCSSIPNKEGLRE